MTCDYAHLDGVYVLGSLAAAERAQYEKHLADCAECARAVREIAGLPGLLSRIPHEVLTEPAGQEVAPSSLLPAVVSEVREARRRRIRGVALLVAAVVLLLGVVGTLTAVLAGNDDGAPSAGSTAPAQQMEGLAGTWVTGWVALVEKDWGTRIELTCTYDDGSSDDWRAYTVVVRTLDGEVEELGSWRAESGKEAHVVLATSVPRNDIAEVVVRTLDGQSVLRLTQ